MKIINDPKDINCVEIILKNVYDKETIIKLNLDKVICIYYFEISGDECIEVTDNKGVNWYDSADNRCENYFEDSNLVYANKKFYYKGEKLWNFG